MKCLALVHDKPLVALLKKFPVALPIHYGMLSPFRGFLYDEKLFILITVTGHYSESYIRAILARGLECILPMQSVNNFQSLCFSLKKINTLYNSLCSWACINVLLALRGTSVDLFSS